jgi:hypothetical protein
MIMVSMRFFTLGAVAALAAALAGCGSTTTNGADASVVSVVVTSPTSGSVIAANNVTLRGTVTPVNAVVQIQGQPAVVGNGVFTGTATLHAGKTTIDVIGSAPGHTPDATSITIAQQSSSASPAPKTSTVTRTVVVPALEHTQPAASSSSASEVFYAPSGNVTCSLQSKSAECSVASINMTFVLPSGDDGAYTIGGLTVARGEGSEAPFDTERSDGEILCSIPAENVPAGITCHDTTTGHGFEASRVAARQKVY